METSHSSANQNTFAIRLQNGETTRIQRRGLIIRARGGLYPGGGGGLSSDLFFRLQIDGLITIVKRGGGEGFLTAVYGMSMQVTLKPIS